MKRRNTHARASSREHREHALILHGNRQAVSAAGGTVLLSAF